MERPPTPAEVTGRGKGGRHLLPERPFGCFAQKVPATFSAAEKREGDETMRTAPTSPLPSPPSAFDALLLVSFGGPESLDDVMPFLENVVRGKNVPPERLREVARHYELFGGVSPLNGQNRALLAALVAELHANGLHLPVYWGNRNWHPLLGDAIAQMAEDGVQRALAFVTSPFGSFPSCRQYIEDIELARQEVGSEAPQIEKLRLFYNHPGFIEPMAERVAAAWDEIPPERRDDTLLLFTAHSIPIAMAERSPYERQLREASRLVAELLAESHPRGVMFDVVFQSRSGPPSQPWLGPDIRDRIRQLPAEGIRDVVVVPIGFLAENIEVVYDLDIEAAALCEELGVNMLRAGVLANHPRFVRMIRELVVERLDPSSPRLSLGSDGPWPDQCPTDCCKPA
jgi:protoporphyrin/coproporphyrin ferrochelatase